ncbi:MAG: gentisate 1,2-dioxygenase [Pseudomonadota bacterium]
MDVRPAETPERQAFYDRIDKQHMTPLWSVLGELVTPEPKSTCQPFGWKFDAIREAMMEAGDLITAKEAERRVLILENPGLRGQSRATTSLYAGVQLVLPGEVAPAHRHTQSALRFVLEGEGAHTAVNGEKTIMRYGDFVITPQMAWHDHGNETQDPMFWLDGLDIPVVSFLDASFAEGLGEDEQEITRDTGQSYAEFGHALMPEGTERAGVSPIFNYPYDRSRESLDAMVRGRDPDPCHGWKLRYTNPLDGGDAMPTIGTAIQLLQGATTPYRSTSATVFVCTEGKGQSRVGDTVIQWGEKDIFVAPSWRQIVHEPESDAVLFSFNDRPIQEKLGLFRETRGNA